MRLPQFGSAPYFVALREKMGAKPAGRFSPVLEFRPVPPAEAVTEAELVRLSREGVEVSEAAVRILDDGTLAFKNRRVLLYLSRTVPLDGLHVRNVKPQSPDDLEETWKSKRQEAFSGEGDPRFHIADCSTLQTMRQTGRGGRYVVSVREDGLFDIASGGNVVSRKLRVCKNCLEKLEWKGFSKRSAIDRDAAVSAFSLAEFFGRYSRTVR